MISRGLGRGHAMLAFSLALFGAGCEMDGKRCREEGEDVLSTWQACNRSCEGKKNQSSCKRAIRLAAEVCAAHRDQEKACSIACESGDAASCAATAEPTRDAKPAPKPPEPPPKDAAADLLADWTTVTIEGASLKLPKRPRPKTSPMPGGHTMHVLGEESADGHYVALTIIKLKDDVGEKMLEQAKTSSFASVPGKTVKVVRRFVSARPAVEVRFTAKKPAGGVEWLVHDRKGKRVVKATVVGNDRFSDALASAVLTTLKIE